MGFNGISIGFNGYEWTINWIINILMGYSWEHECQEMANSWI
jgi:hypothetical protein